ncbi:unnamed protein product [Rhizoctonia solani]|uniref:Protein PBN1 n=1 Tax=Rhizoctonia solani TaxID=456999 RepID=A0A8H3CUJ5_9AGAM|nr:unnamed protein product [Rhizoctonia solani]
MRLAFSSTLFIISFSRIGFVCGNTEILNFDSALSLDVPELNVSRHSIDARSSTRLFSLELAPHQTLWSDVCDGVNDCPYEVFIKLNLEKSHDGPVLGTDETPKYSLRISSTPSPPAQFKVEVLTPKQAYEITAKRAGFIPTGEDTQNFPLTRTIYARIRARDAGVLVPQEMTWHFFPPLVPRPSNIAHFHLILDPLLFGFIPKSVVPVIWAILVAGVSGIWCLGWVKGHLDALALRVCEQIEDGR